MAKHVWGYERISVHMYMCVCRQKVYLRYHSSKPSLFLTQFSYWDPGLQIKLGWLASEPRDSSVSVFQHWNHKSTHSFLAFYTGAWDWTQVLMLAWQHFTELHINPSFVVRILTQYIHITSSMFKDRVSESTFALNLIHSSGWTWPSCLYLPSSGILARQVYTTMPSFQRCLFLTCLNSDLVILGGGKHYISP